jgi:antagonist of KipI
MKKQIEHPSVHPPIAQIEVQEAGLRTTLQDLGRPTGRRYGIPLSGALDRFAHSVANDLVFNPADAATLEITLQGPRLFFRTPALIAITGADMKPHLNGWPMPMWMSVFVRDGQILEFTAPRIRASSQIISGRMHRGWSVNPTSEQMAQLAKNIDRGPGQSWGSRAYLAVQGGFDAPLVLGSRSTHLRAKLGGYLGRGRELVDGDLLYSGEPQLLSLTEAAGKSFPLENLPPYGAEVTVRVVMGPYEEHFDEKAYNTLFSSTYTLSTQSDRMGYRLEGPCLTHSQATLGEVGVCGTVFGAIQVPANGQPIVLMADHQVTGGYPIIGTVVSGDLPLIAQLLPGDKVRFVLAED